MLSMIDDKYFKEPILHVEWDDDVRESLKLIYRATNHADIPINLMDLLIGIGSVQSKRIQPSLQKSLMDYDFLIDYLTDNPELRIRISETKATLGSEFLKEVSELMGIGLSVVVASKIFDVQPSTISKITDTPRKRPDWNCCLNNNQTLIVEAKGSTSASTSKQQMKKAVEQKLSKAGDVRIATATVLNESSCSCMTITDPPGIEDFENNSMKRHIFRANHYTSVFSFLGDEELCLYFEKMAKRLSGMIGPSEMEDKEQMYKELSYQNPHIYVGGRSFAGHLYGPFNRKYVYLGVDSRLLSYNGFMVFKDSDEEKNINEDDNQYLIKPDGVIVANIQNAEAFMREHQLQSIQIGYDNIALSDIDSIRAISFKRYVKYLLEKCYGEAVWTEKGTLRVQRGTRRKEFVVYHLQKSSDRPATWKQADKALEYMQGKEGTLVTNLWLPRWKYGYPCIDRSDFSRIAESRAEKWMLEEVFGVF